MSYYSIPKKIGFFSSIPLFIFLLSLPTPKGLSTEGHMTLATAVVMALLWITEAIPVPVTALIPLAVFPVLGISNAKTTASSYGHHFIFLFMGGFFIAKAMEQANLHKRIALHIISIIGCSPKRIIMGFMCATAFLSMWISNTATTIMMLPIGIAVSNHVKTIAADSGPDKNFFTCLMLSIAYSASIGGIGTLIGTPPNIVFAGAVKSIFPKAPEIGYFQWMLIGIPLVVIFLPSVWYFLTSIIFPVSQKELPGGAELISNNLKELGRIKKDELYVLIISMVTAVGWITRKDINFGLFTLSGWSSLFERQAYIQDSTVAMAGAILLFLIPVDLKKGNFLLSWDKAREIPWGILILFGGGIALAKGFKETGLAAWIGGKLAALSFVSPVILIFCTCILLTFLTEITSNTATATIFMPILAATASAIHIHPYLLMVPAVISASSAFMLPVATPPNAIIFSSGYISISQMARAGFFINLFGAVIVTLITYFIVAPVFHISFTSMPVWMTP